MGVFSEMDMEQYENTGTEPFQMDMGGKAIADKAMQVNPAQKQVNAYKQKADSGLITTVSKVKEQVINNEDDSQEQPEDMDRKAHEEAEAKRKAEWDAQQAAKKAAEREKIQQIETMSDDDVMMASARRVSDDTEKITRRNMKDCVSEVIQTKCLDDPAFARLVMHPRKSMVNCFKYITRKAWEYVQDELRADGITPGNGAQGYGCDVPDDLCYQWAEDYFKDPDAKEDQQTEEKFVPKPYYGKTSSKSSSKKAHKDSAKKIEKKSEPDKPPASDQISLLDMDMLEAAS